MMVFDVLAGTEYKAGAMDNGKRIGIEIVDAEMSTHIVPQELSVRVRQTRIHGSLHDMRRLYYHLGLALDDAETLAGIDSEARAAYLRPSQLQPRSNPHECDFGPGQNDSRCPRCR